MATAALCDEPGIVRINFTLKAARPAPVCTVFAPSFTLLMGLSQAQPATKTFQGFVIDLCDKVIEALVGTVQRGV
jgi:hypothetical protein